MSRTLSGKVVLVTGASSGIGAAVAREAARQGHHLALTARRADRLNALAAECRAEGVDVLVVPADLADPEAPARIIGETVGRFGGLDVLVNNAGYGLPTLFHETDPEALRRQVEVLFVAPLLLARHALPYLTERRGTLITIGSAITSMPNPALGAYGACKAGLAYWNAATRRELTHKGLRVCLVEPGPIRTEFFDAIRPQTNHKGYHPLVDAPYWWMTQPVDVAARRIVRLIRYPRRRLSTPRRVVWAWRFFGAVCECFPGLGDAAISAVIRHFERQAARRAAKHRLAEATATKTVDSRVG